MDSLKRKLLFVSVLFSSLIVNAQQVEVGLMLGASNYLGDLSNETFVMKESHFSGSLFGRYNFSPRFALKGNFGYARVSGDDKNFASEKRDYVLNQVLTQDFEFNKARNLNFFSDIYEFSLHGEFNLLPNDLNSYSARPFIPYVFLGIGIFNFNPKTTYNNNTVELHPVATEGQGSTTYNDFKPYNLTSICIPIGLGFRQKIADDFFLGIEGGFRFTRTNYLDDVGGVYGSRSVISGATGRTGLHLSDRSWELAPSLDPMNNPNPLSEAYLFNENDKRSVKETFKNDMYFMVGITLSYTLRFRGQGCPQF
jgi:hypothetical protein